MQAFWRSCSFRTRHWKVWEHSWSMAWSTIRPLWKGMPILSFKINDWLFSFQLPFFTWSTSCQYPTKCRWGQSTNLLLISRRLLISSTKRSLWQRNGRRAPLRRFEEALFKTTWKMWATSCLRSNCSIIDAIATMQVGVNSFCYGVYNILDGFRAEYSSKFHKKPYVNPVTRWRWRVPVS